MALAVTGRALVRFLLLGLVLALSALALSGNAHAAEPTAPSDLRIEAVTTDASKVSVSWKPPAQPPLQQITSYRLKLDGRQVAEFKILFGHIKPPYTIDRSLLNAGGAATIAGAYGISATQETPPSDPVRIEPAAQAAAATAATAQAADTAADPSAEPQSETTLVTPPYKDQNQPTPLEVYGDGIGILQLQDTNGVADMLPRIANSISGILWLLAVVAELIGVSLIAWSLIGNLYTGLAAGATAVIVHIQLSPVYTGAMLLAATLAMAWGAVMLLKDQSRIARGIGISFLALFALMVLMGRVDRLVPELIRLPSNAAQVAVAEVNRWQLPGRVENKYNLSVEPTYNGDENEQAVRRYANESWLEKTYAPYCQLNFGSLKWATTTYVPNSDDLPEYRDLTFCEYLLKAKTEKNDAALAKLESGERANGIFRPLPGDVGHRKGYIEEASPLRWEFYQASAPATYGLRFMFSSAVLGASIFDGLFKGVAAAVIVYATTLLALDAILVFLLLIFAQVPPWVVYLSEHLKSMARRTAVPAVLMLLLIVSNRILSILFSATGERGWLLETLLSGVGTLVVLGYGVMKFIRYSRSASSAGPTEGGAASSGGVGTPARPDAPAPPRPQARPTFIAPTPAVTWAPPRGAQPPRMPQRPWNGGGQVTKTRAPQRPIPAVRKRAS